MPDPTSDGAVPPAPGAGADPGTADGVVPPGPEVATGVVEAAGDEWVSYELTVDGRPAAVTARWDESLLTVLRERLGVRGPKLGCGHGRCGACTVSLTVDGRTRPACACLLPAAAVAGAAVDTVASLAAPDGTLSAVQDAFVAAGAVQCGYCTAGMVQSATALLDRNPDPTRDDIVAALYGNLCRCTGYGRIVDAVRTAAATRRNR